MSDLIDRQAAIDALKQQAEAMSEWSNRYAEQRKGVLTAVNIVEDLPPAQPPIQQILTDDDLETLRIHMSAFKENLCNQHRWNEANEYQTLVDKLIILRERSTDGCFNQQTGGD